MKSAFPIARAQSGSTWMVALSATAILASGFLLVLFREPALEFWIVGILLVAVVLLAGYTAYSMHNLRVEIGSREMRLRGDLYGRTIPTDKLQLEKARIVDLRNEPELQPVLRTNGIGLPGYQVGWFRLKNGETALLYVTDESTVTYLPTTEHDVLLLSVENAEAFLQALREPTRR
jgi:hypothetical protein